MEEKGKEIERQVLRLTREMHDRPFNGEKLMLGEKFYYLNKCCASSMNCIQ